MVAAAFLLLPEHLFAQAVAQARKLPQQSQPDKTLVLPMQYYGASDTLSELARRELPSVSKENGMLQEDQMEKLFEEPEAKRNKNVGPATTQTGATAPLAAVPGISFEGPGLGMAGFVIAGAPPDTTLAVGEAFDPAPANIEARTTRSTLPSGFKLALLPKKTRGRAVFATLNLRYGSEQALMNRGSAAGLVAKMLLRGTRSKSRQQIQDDLDRLKARVLFFGNPTSAAGGIETTRDNLPAVLRLVGEVLRHPAFDAKEFAALKQRPASPLRYRVVSNSVHCCRGRSASC